MPFAKPPPENGPRFECTTCGKCFCEPKRLVTHGKTHTAEKIYICPHCEKGFARRGNLNTHLRTHSGEKPEKCEICGRAFSHRGSLTRHMKTHSGERSFECEYCDKAFLQRSNLTAHLRVHTGEKPFKCGQCNKGFAQKGNLKYHLTTHDRNRKGRKRGDSCSKLKKQKPQRKRLKNTRRVGLSTNLESYSADLPSLSSPTSSSEQSFGGFSPTRVGSADEGCDPVPLKKPHQPVPMKKRPLRTPFDENGDSSNLISTIPHLEMNTPYVSSKECPKSELSESDYCDQFDSNAWCSNSNEDSEPHVPDFETELEEVGEIHVVEDTSGATLQDFSASSASWEGRRDEPSSHSSSSSSSSSARFQCKTCPRTFDTRSVLGDHMRAHSLNGTRPYKCEICDKRFTYWFTYQQHTKDHQGERAEVPALDRKRHKRKRSDNKIQVSRHVHNRGRKRLREDRDEALGTEPYEIVKRERRRDKKSKKRQKKRTKRRDSEKDRGVKAERSTSGSENDSQDFGDQWNTLTPADVPQESPTTPSSNDTKNEFVTLQTQSFPEEDTEDDMNMDTWGTPQDFNKLFSHRGISESKPLRQHETMSAFSTSDPEGPARIPADNFPVPPQSPRTNNCDPLHSNLDLLAFQSAESPSSPMSVAGLCASSTSSAHPNPDPTLLQELPPNESQTSAVGLQVSPRGSLQGLLAVPHRSGLSHRLFESPSIGRQTQVPVSPNGQIERQCRPEVVYQSPEVEQATLQPFGATGQFQYGASPEPSLTEILPPQIHSLTLPPMSDQSSCVLGQNFTHTVTDTKSITRSATIDSLPCVSTPTRSTSLKSVEKVCLSQEVPPGLPSPILPGPFLLSDSMVKFGDSVAVSSSAFILDSSHIRPPAGCRQ